MSVTLIDSEIFGDLFSTNDMRNLFDDAAQLQRMVDVEAALARAQASIGIIPQSAADEITAKARFENFDHVELARQTSLAAAPVMGLVAQLSKICGDDAGRYVHWGATTQDIVDTALVLQMRDGFGLLEQQIETVSSTLAKLAASHSGTIMMGRTYLQHALPITFGYKAAVWLSGLLDVCDRLERVKQRAACLQFGGAVGTLASLGNQGLDVAWALGRELDLKVPDIGWHVVRGALADVAGTLSELVGVLGKIAIDICLLSQTEVAELAEPHAPGRGGSSTMPQKRNPVTSVLILSIMRNVQALAGTVENNMAFDHERPVNSWQAEWLAIPQMFVLCSGALAHAGFVLEGLQVDEARMRANIDISQGLVMAEAVMMALGPHLGHARAHDLVEELCNTARSRKITLGEALAEHKEISDRLDQEAIEDLLDPANYIGVAGTMVDQVLVRYRKGLKSS